MTTQDNESDFPTEHIKTVQNFQTSLSELDTVLKDLFDVPLSEIHETKATTPLDKAKLDIISAFALNSLTWMWLRTQGTNPKETEVKSELDRIKASWMRLQQIQDKSKRNQVDQEAAKRFVSSSLWKPGEEKIRHNEESSKAPKRRSNELKSNSKKAKK